MFGPYVLRQNKENRKARLATRATPVEVRRRNSRNKKSSSGAIWAIHCRPRPALQPTQAAAPGRSWRPVVVTSAVTAAVNTGAGWRQRRRWKWQPPRTMAPSDRRRRENTVGRESLGRCPQATLLPPSTPCRRWCPGPRPGQSRAPRPRDGSRMRPGRPGTGKIPWVAMLALLLPPPILLRRCEGAPSA